MCIDSSVWCIVDCQTIVAAQKEKKDKDGQFVETCGSCSRDAVAASWTAYVFSEAPDITSGAQDDRCARRLTSPNNHPAA